MLRNLLFFVLLAGLCAASPASSAATPAPSGGLLSRLSADVTLGARKKKPAPAPEGAETPTGKGATKAGGKKPVKGNEPAEEKPSKPDPDDMGEGLGGVQRSNRMEFDARLIQGERPKAGAVYLFQRAPRQLPALVVLRPSYLQEIVVPVLGLKVWRDGQRPPVAKPAP